MTRLCGRHPGSISGMDGSLSSMSEIHFRWTIYRSSLTTERDPSTTRVPAGFRNENGAGPPRHAQSYRIFNNSCPK